MGIGDWTRWLLGVATCAAVTFVVSLWVFDVSAGQSLLTAACACAGYGVVAGIYARLQAATRR